MARSLELSHQEINLIASADRCERHLGRLKKRASDLRIKHTTGKKHAVLEKAITHCNSNIKSLKNWTAAFNQGRQTSNRQIRASTNEFFNVILSKIADAEKALDKRLELHFWATKSKYGAIQFSTRN